MLISWDKNGITVALLAQTQSVKPVIEPTPFTTRQLGQYNAQLEIPAIYTLLGLL